MLLGGFCLCQFGQPWRTWILHLPVRSLQFTQAIWLKIAGEKHNINIRNRNTSNFNTVGATLIIYWINIFWPGHTQGLWVKWTYWYGSHQDTLGPHIYSFAGKNSRVALRTRRHGLMSPWLAKRQRAKKGPATGCTAWTCARNANRRLISSNIALQRDSLRESKGSKKRHRGLSSAGCQQLTHENQDIHSFGQPNNQPSH